ncbi:MAG: ABC transporter ATP-binding protein, partial [Candidatus Krumholzibacteriota bacterium]|nr:ABC transporter ATP-binding protein [Candidatus Krumholzibacteriota bacterium]
NGGLAFEGEVGSLPLAGEDLAAMAPHTGKPVFLGIRPEDIYAPDYMPQKAKGHAIETEIDVVEPMGNELFLYVKIRGGQLVARVDPRLPAGVGQSQPLMIDMSKAHFFDAETEEHLV